MVATTFPYPGKLRPALWPQVKDADWQPDELTEPLTPWLMIGGRTIPFAEHVDHARRVIRLAVWPWWADMLGLLSLPFPLFDWATPTTVAVTFTTDDTYTVHVGDEETPRLTTSDPCAMRNAVWGIVDSI